VIKNSKKNKRKEVREYLVFRLLGGIFGGKQNKKEKYIFCNDPT